MQNGSNKFLVPGAVVIVLLLVAIGLYTKGQNPSAGTTPDATGDASEILKVTATDNVMGNPDALVTIFEYSDIQCPACAFMHPQLEEVVKTRTDVKWVYRHFPLITIHPNARPAAIASQCIAKLKDEGTFFSFLHESFSNQALLGDGYYKDFAKKSGIDEKAFADCLKDSEIAKEVDRQMNEAISLGAKGTPHIIFVGPKESKTIAGATRTVEDLVAEIMSVSGQ